MNRLIALSAVVVLAGCGSTGQVYPERETAMNANPQAQFATPVKPIQVRFDVTRHDVRFEGDAVLSPKDVDRLTRTLSGYHIAHGDTIRLVPFGAQSRALADRRLTGVGTAIVNLGHTASVGGNLDAEAEGAGVAILIGRWKAEAPGCPDWSQPAGSTYANTITSNFGCADAVNLAAMLEDPNDLLRGRPYTGTSSGLPASAISTFSAASSVTAGETEPMITTFTDVSGGGSDEESE